MALVALMLVDPMLQLTWIAQVLPAIQTPRMSLMEIVGHMRVLQMLPQPNPVLTTVVILEDQYLMVLVEQLHALQLIHRLPSPVQPAAILTQSTFPMVVVA